MCVGLLVGIECVTISLAIVLAIRASQSHLQQICILRFVNVYCLCLLLIYNPHRRGAQIAFHKLDSVEEFVKFVRICDVSSGRSNALLCVILGCANIVYALDASVRMLLFCCLMVVQTCRRTNVQTYKFTNSQTYRRTDVQTHRRTISQTYRHTDAVTSDSQISIRQQAVRVNIV